MTACPVGGVSVTIMVTEVADAGRYFETSTLIGAGSAGAAGGDSSCTSCTRAGGVCISMIWYLYRWQGQSQNTKRGTRHQVPLIKSALPPQKLKVMPVVAALIVAPP